MNGNGEGYSPAPTAYLLKDDLEEYGGDLSLETNFEVDSLAFSEIRYSVTRAKWSQSWIESLGTISTPYNEIISGATGLLRRNELLGIIGPSGSVS